MKKHQTLITDNSGIGKSRNVNQNGNCKKTTLGKEDKDKTKMPCNREVNQES